MGWAYYYGVIAVLFLWQSATHLYGPIAAGALGVLMIRRITALPIAPDAIVVLELSRAPPTNHVAFCLMIRRGRFEHDDGDRERGGRSDKWNL